MAKYDLTGSLEKEFTFAIGDKEFNFRKPTVREMREIAKRFSNIEKVEDTEEQTRLSDEAMEELYKFVNPIDHDSDLKELLYDLPVGVQMAFNDMIKKELGTES